MHPLELFKFCPVCGSPHFEIHNEKSKKCADCGFVYYFNSSAATVAFILNGKGELLVCRRGKEPAKGTLDLSGGFIDMFETGEEGVAREVKRGNGSGGDGSEISVFLAQHVSVLRFPGTYTRPVLLVSGGR